MSEGVVEVGLHPRWGRRNVCEKVEKRLVIRTEIKGYKVVVAIVPSPACCWYVCLGAAVPIEEIVGAGPASGYFPCDKHLIHFRLLHEENGRVYSKQLEYTLEAVLDV